MTDKADEIIAAAEAVTTAIDDTLTQRGKPADAKKVGDEISDIKAELSEIDDAKEYTSEIGSVILELLKKAAYIDEDSNQYIEELANLIESGESGRVGDEELRNVILDTDFGNVDDYFGIRIVAQAHKNKLINVIGVNASSLATSAADAQITAFSRFLNYEGLGAIDMGFNKNNMNTGEGETTIRMREAISNNWSYGRYTSFNSVDSSVAFYRKTLAGIKGKVDIICIGGLAAISDLLDSTADSYSPMSGIELISAKVDTLWVMGGKYPTGRSWNFYKNNVAKISTNNVFQNYPGKIVFQGDELGSSVICGSTLKDTVGTDDLLYKIMVAHTSSYGQNGCASHDAITTLLGVYGDTSVAGYGIVIGTNTFDTSDGTNTFVTSETGKHCYVVTHHSASHHAYEINDIITKIGM